MRTSARTEPSQDRPYSSIRSHLKILSSVELKQQSLFLVADTVDMQERSQL